MRVKAVGLTMVGVLLCCATAVGMANPAAAHGPRAHKSITGGQAVSPAQWGFTVALVTPRELCTGVVIAPLRVLTAAHCARDTVKTTVRANSPFAFFGGETRSVEGAAVAPGYDRRHNDIAVLKLSAPTTATPITLASAADDAAYTPVGNPLSIAGFGRRNPSIFGKPKVGVLTAATTYSVTGCRWFLSPATEVCDQGGRIGTAFSARKRRPVMRDTCGGDSGGPLVANTPAGPRLLGILSGGLSLRRGPFSFIQCGLRGYPSIHVRVAPYLGFIQSQL